MKYLVLIICFFISSCNEPYELSFSQKNINLIRIFRFNDKEFFDTVLIEKKDAISMLLNEIDKSKYEENKFYPKYAMTLESQNKKYLILINGKFIKSDGRSYRIQRPFSQFIGNLDFINEK